MCPQVNLYSQPLLPKLWNSAKLNVGTSAISRASWMPLQPHCGLQPSHICFTVATLCSASLIPRASIQLVLPTIFMQFSPLLWRFACSSLTSRIQPPSTNTILLISPTWLSLKWPNPSSVRLAYWLTRQFLLSWHSCLGPGRTPFFEFLPPYPCASLDPSWFVIVTCNPSFLQFGSFSAHLSNAKDQEMWKSPSPCPEPQLSYYMWLLPEWVAVAAPN